MMQQMLWNFDTTISPEDVITNCPREGRFTRLMIAREMRRSKSPSLIGAISQAVEKGWLEQEFVTLPNGVDMYTYMLTDLGRMVRADVLVDGALG